MLMITLPALYSTPRLFNPMIILWSCIILLFMFLHTSPYPILLPNPWLFLDNLTLSLIILTLITLILISISSPNFSSSVVYILPICLILVVTFTTNDIMIFYVSFELVLIPTFLLITHLGNQPERLQASLYLILYTVFASLPLLGSIIFITPFSSFILMTTSSTQLSYPLLFTLAFLVKLPMFFTHLWLPKAHVEAPLEGSMILAAVLLKLGGYGILRFAPTISKSSTSLTPWLISISLLGATLTSLNCSRQKDLKALIAYSSVAHMALVIASLFTFKTLSPSSSLMMMIGHGLSSSALFFLVNILYTQHHTRNMMAFKGLIHTFPPLTLWWFLFTATNISAPPSINFISEILIFSSLTTWNYYTMIPIFTASLATATFSFTLYSTLTHTHNTLILYSYTPSPKQFLSLYTHFIPIILLTAKPEILIYLNSLFKTMVCGTIISIMS